MFLWKLTLLKGTKLSGDMAVKWLQGLVRPSLWQCLLHGLSLIKHNTGRTKDFPMQSSLCVLTLRLEKGFRFSIQATPVTIMRSLTLFPAPCLRCLRKESFWLQTGIPSCQLMTAGKEVSFRGEKRVRELDRKR